MRASPIPAAIFAAIFAVISTLLVLAACGGGGGSDHDQLSLDTRSVPAAIVGVAYETKLEASGGLRDYVWTVVEGSLPPGLALASDGEVTGTPTAIGRWSPRIRVRDNDGTGQKRYRHIDFDVAAGDTMLESFDDTSGEDPAASPDPLGWSTVVPGELRAGVHPRSLLRRIGIESTGSSVAGPFSGAVVRFQALYLPEEVAGLGAVRRLRWVPASPTVEASYLEVTVALGHTDRTDLDTDLDGNMLDRTVVAEIASLDVPGGLPAAGPLDLPIDPDAFEYDGERNLVVEIVVGRSLGTEPGNPWRTSPGQTGRIVSGDLSANPGVPQTGRPDLEIETEALVLWPDGLLPDSAIGAPFAIDAVFDAPSRTQVLLRGADLQRGLSGTFPASLLTGLHWRSDAPTLAGTYDGLSLLGAITDLTDLATSTTFDANLIDASSVETLVDGDAYSIPAGSQWSRIPILTALAIDAGAPDDILLDFLLLGPSSGNSWSTVDGAEAGILANPVGGEPTGAPASGTVVAALEMGAYSEGESVARWFDTGLTELDYFFDPSSTADLAMRGDRTRVQLWLEAAPGLENAPAQPDTADVVSVSIDLAGGPADLLALRDRRHLRFRIRMVPDSAVESPAVESLAVGFGPRD